ncbi:MAG: sugar phosphate isomerase/epimerase family protein [Saprospiraceae bacterium]
MKLGMNMLLWTTFVNEDYFPHIEKIKKVGYDGIEVPIDDGDAKDYRKVGDFLKSLGMTCTAVSSVFEEENPASPDAKIRQKGVDALKWRIDMAAEMGAEVIVGPYHSAFAYFSGKAPTADERKWSAEVLHQAAEYAAGTGVILTPEALNRFECYLFNTLASIAKLLREVNHPNLRMIYDTHHAHIEEKSQGGVIQKYADLIAHVHLSENDRGTPGTGQVQWDEIFENLQAIGYDKWLTIEAFSRYNEEFANGINVWRNYQADTNEVYEQGHTFIRNSWARYA